MNWTIIYYLTTKYLDLHSGCIEFTFNNLLKLTINIKQLTFY